jgi:hypothetical protein
MNETGSPVLRDELDPSAIAAWFAFVAGALSTFVPFFVGLVAALVALVVVSRILQYRRVGRRLVSDPRVAIAGLGLAAVVAVFLWTPESLLAVRGLLLGGMGLTFWWFSGESAAGRGGVR